MKQISLFQKYLSLHKLSDDKKKKGIKGTHTAIPNPEKGTHGGNYYIDSDDLDEFYKTYMDDVFKKNNIGHLTERQLEENGPIAIDLDFRYGTDVKKRLHTETHIENIITTYLEKLQENIFDFEVKQDIPIYVFEKKNVNMLDKMTKDGIHIIIGIACDRRIQLLLRNIVLKDMPDILDELPFTNSIEDVIDLSVTKGGTNWQLFGSCKPNHEPYEITQYYNYYLNDDYQFEMTNMKLADKNILDKFKNNFDFFKKISVRYEDNIELNPKAKITEYLVKQNNSEIRLTTNKENCNISYNSHYDDMSSLIANINTLEQLKKINEKILDVDITKEINRTFKQTHNYLMIINNPKYYDPYSEWRDIGFALKNTDERLFLSWMLFSAKSKKFEIQDICKYYGMWKKDFNVGERCFTYKSIERKAKSCYIDVDDDENEWKKLYKTNIDYFIETAISGNATDYDIASILVYMYKGDFMCVGKSKSYKWFKFEKNRWKEINGEVAIARIISEQLYDKLQDKMFNIINLLHNYPGGSDSEGYKNLESKVAILNKMCQYCKDRTHKMKILGEVRDMFHDEYFLKQKDMNNYLLGFDNGIFDFNENRFRPGYHEDYMTKGTNYKYIPMDIIKTQYQEEEQEIRTFFDQIYPIKEMNDYMWNLLASLLIGGNMNQEFYMFIGNGSNGKSMVIKLLEDIMGDYFGSLPSSCITGARPKPGQVSPEVIALKGTRVAVINEPKRDETLNDGIVKEMTGNTDKVQGRALYGDPDSFIPQFKPIVATNVTYNINDTTDGIWRRIKKINHISKFEDKPNLKNENEFQKDKSLSKRFTKWAPVLMTLLIEIAIKTRGEITTPQIIIDETLAYRNKQDLVSEFINSRIQFEEGGKIKKTPLFGEYKLHLDRNTKKSELEELEEAMNTKFGEYDNKKKCWKNVKLIYESDEDDEDDE
jgi:P4 family phage/plasmid primase-like protien